MIRKATPDDIRAIVELGLEALNKGAYKNMVVSREKVEALAIQGVSSARNFAWVAEKDGFIGGSLVAIVHECMCYERQQASVVQWYCKIPGDGISLMREFIRWADSRPIIKMKVVSLEYDADPRIGNILIRLGLNITLPAYIGTQ
jgi:hypothetical protein